MRSRQGRGWMKHEAILIFAWLIIPNFQALGEPNGGAAASLAVAEKYVTAFGELAKQSTTVLLPANTGDVDSMVAQAMAVYGKMNNSVNTLPTVPEETEPEETHRSEVNINLD